MLAGCGEVTLEELMDELGNPDIEPSELERWLKKRKSPWMRAVLGEGTPWSQLSPDVVAVVERWLEGVLTRREARAMLRDLGARLSVRR